MRQLVLWFLLTGGSALAQQYIISTYAGGAPPPTPASALKSSLGYPQSVAADRYGNVFFTSLNCVFKLDSSGTLTRIAGNSRAGFFGDGGPALNAQLFLPEPYYGDQFDYMFPGGLAVDYSDNVYVADQGNGRVRMIGADGIITTVAGGGTVYTEGALATSVWISPTGLAVDSTGNLFISDINRVVRKVNPNGIISTFAGNGSFGFSGDGGPATAAQFNNPAGLATDGHGNLYIADAFNGRIRKVTPDGVITSVAFVGLVESLAIDSAGNIYAGDVDGSGVAGVDSYLFKVTADGTVTTLGSNSCASYIPCSGFQPWGVAVDSAGNLLIAGGGGRVRRMTPDGTITAVAGNGTYSDSGDGRLATSAQFTPNGVALDNGGNLYIADTTASRIRKISRGGTIATIAGNGTSGYSGDGGLATSAQIDPQAVTVDAAGNVYIAETARVRKISADGTITTVAGNGNVGFSGDGGPAINAQLSCRALAIDNAGNLYVSDAYNFRVRKVSPDGTITTVAGNGHPPNGGTVGDGGPAIDAPLIPGFLAVDTAGNLYTGGGQVVRKVSPDGIITTVAGSPTAPDTFSGDGGPAIAAGLAVEGLTVDSSGNLFIADSVNDRVRVVSPNGIITTVAGSGATYASYGYGGGGYTGDGGLATNAKLNPTGLTADSGGNVYVADSPNGAVRLLQPVSGMNVSAVENAASGLAGPVAPGEMVVLFGFGLGPNQLVTAVPENDGNFATTLAGTMVQINGIPAPLVYTWVTQIAAIVPASVTGATAQFTVTYQGQTTAPISIPLAAAAPGIFTADSSGIGIPITINQNGAIDTIARPGDTLTVFTTGLGQMAPTVLLDGWAVGPISYGSVPGGVEGITQITFPIQPGQDCNFSIAISAGGASSQPGIFIPLSVCI
ncbi:MAG: hypothetical protein ABSB15_23395 [Bryobacteraceae bacterium]